MQRESIDEFALVPMKEGDDIYTKTMQSFKESNVGDQNEEENKQAA